MYNHWVMKSYKLVFIFSLGLLVLFQPRFALAQFGKGITSPFGDKNAYTNVDKLTASPEAPFSVMELIISNVLGLITVLGAVLFITYFLLGAVGWITAGGDSGKITKARDQIVHGVIGLIILVIAYSVVGLIGTVLGMNEILSPANALKALIPR